VTISGDILVVLVVLGIFGKLFHLWEIVSFVGNCYQCGNIPRPGDILKPTAISVCKLDERKRIIVPGDLVESWGIGPGDKVSFWDSGDGQILITPGGMIPGDLVGVGPKSSLDGIPRDGFTGERIHRLYSGGKTVTEISELAGVDKSVISRRYKKYRDSLED